MTTTLAEARTRVRAMIDDTAAALVDDAEIDAALATAQEETWLLAVGSGTNLFNREAEVTTTQGVADLSSLRPLKLINVAEAVGDARYNIQPARHAEALRNATVTKTLKLQYVPRASFPANDADPFVWGDDALELRVLDDLMCLIAGSQLKITEGEVNAALERRKEELKLAAISQLNIPGYYVMPLSSLGRRRNSSYLYVMTAPFTLQLVR